MPSRSPRRTLDRNNRLLESLESRVLLSGAVPTYNFGVVSSLVPALNAISQGMVMAPNGDLYGTTARGGPHAYGTIFEIPAGTNTVVTLAQFNGANGFYPRGNLVLDANGNLFGTTVDGGTGSVGTVFELKAGSNAITSLGSFTNLTGGFPTNGLVEHDGILYGEAYGLGTFSNSSVFSIDPNAPVIENVAVFTTSVAFNSTLVINADGDIFGTSSIGGVVNRGSIFEIPHGTSTVNTIYSFNGVNGYLPLGSLVLQDQGDNDITNDVIYGETSAGGAFSAGTLFAFSPNTAALTTLVSFNITNGFQPVGSLVEDAGGNLFGVTTLGGASNLGSVFEYSTTDGTLSTLHSFTTALTGVTPSGPLVLDAHGNLFGATFSGGTYSAGTIFELGAQGAPQSAVSMGVVQQPTSTTAGHDFFVTVAIRDVFGNIVTTDNSNVTLALSTPNNGATENGLLTVAAVNGVATFDLNIDTVGGYSFTVSDGNFSKLTTQAFTITPGAPSQLVFLGAQPYGNPNLLIRSTVQVAVEDAFGNIVTSNSSKITMSVATGPGTIGGTVVAPAFNGIANFTNIRLSAAGTYTLQASDPNLASATGGAVVGAATKMVFTQQPLAVVAGQDFAKLVALSLLTPANLVAATDPNSTVTLTINSGPAGAKFLTGPNTHATSITGTFVNGKLVFTGASDIQFDTAGTYTLAVTIPGLPRVVSASFVVSPAAPTLVITQQPTGTGVSTALKPPVVVKLEDQFGNVVTTNNTLVTLTANGPGAAAGTTAVRAVGGVATFANLNLPTAGTYTLTATDGVIPSAISSSFVIGAATHLVITKQPTITVAGHTMTPVTVQVEDATGHVVIGDNSTITLGITSSRGAAMLGGTISMAAVNGVATFNAIMPTVAGTFNLVATDSSPTVAFVLSNPFTVSPDVATQLVINQQPSDVGASTTMSVPSTIGPIAVVAKPVIVWVEDQFGNIVTTNGSRVTLSTASGPATTLAGNVVNAVGGVATFTTFTVKTAGTYTLTAADGTLTAATSDPFTVSTAARVIFSKQPVAAVAGVALPTITVTLQDAFGRAVAADGSSVTLSITTPNNSVQFASGATTVQVAEVNGQAVATFTGLVLDTSGTFALTASDGGLTQALSSAFIISPAAADHIVVKKQPTNMVAGALVTPIFVAVEDQFNNVVTTSAAPVKITAVTGPGTLTGTTGVGATSGVAVFNALSLKTAGTYSFTFTAALPTITTTTTDTFTVSPAAATKMVFTVPPAAATANTAIAPAIVVTLQDAFGNVATTDTSVVQLVVSTHPVGGALAGIFTVPVIDGTATFADAQLTTAGNYTLRPLDGGILSVISPLFTVSP